jgi:hypothetical protein
VTSPPGSLSLKSREGSSAPGTGRRDIGSNRSLDDPNDVVVAVEFPEEERARSFLADPALKEEMEQAGVQGQPTVVLCDEVEAVNY